MADFAIDASEEIVFHVLFRTPNNVATIEDRVRVVQAAFRDHCRRRFIKHMALVMLRVGVYSPEMRYVVAQHSGLPVDVQKVVPPTR